jgi:transposase
MRKLKLSGPASPQAVRDAYNASEKKRDRERLQAIMLGQQSYTLAEIAWIVGRGRATVARWIRLYRQGGLEALLKTRYKGRAGSVSSAIQQELVQGLQQGRWKRAKDIQAWLHRQGCPLQLSGVYYWLYKLKGRWKVPRRSHIKKAWG